MLCVTLNTPDCGNKFAIPFHMALVRNRMLGARPLPQTGVYLEKETASSRASRSIETATLLKQIFASERSNCTREFFGGHFACRRPTELPP